MKCFLKTVTCGAILFAGVLGSHESEAALLMSSNGSGACKAAYGASQSFYFANLYAENVSNSAQYLNCVLPLARETLLNIPLGLTGYRVDMHFESASTATQSVSCVAQIAWKGQVAETQSMSVKSATIPVAQSAIVQFNRSELVIRDPFAPVTVSCLIPPGVRLGRIDQYQPETTILGLP